MNSKTLLSRKNLITLGCVIASSLLMASTNNLFVKHAGLLSGGFMGIAILTEMIGDLVHINIPTSVTLVLLNAPVALFCARRISRRFVFFSLTQVFLTSLFLRMIPVRPIFEEQLLNIIFGGVLWGSSITLALKGGASSGGTDFIALYVANKTGREIWMQVFAMNTALLAIFGILFGFDKAGYSVLFQYISTHIVSTFHTRYKRVTLQIFTQKQEDVLHAYLKHFHHGITALHGTGGFSGQPTTLLLAVISSYELNDAIEVLKEADPHIIINVLKSERFVGRFHLEEI